MSNYRKQRWPTAVWIVKRKVKKGGFSYRLRWQDKYGRWHSEGCGRDFLLAKELRAQKKEELRRGETGEVEVVSLSQLVDQLPVLMAGKASNTIHKTQVTLRALDKACGPTTLQGIDRAMIMRFRAGLIDRGLATASVNKAMREVKSALSYAVDGSLLKMNPLLRWKQLMLKEPQRLIRIVTPEEYSMLLASAASVEFRALLVVAYQQGLRRAELANLRWQGPNGEPVVDFGCNVLQVTNRPEKGELTKSRKSRTIPLHPEAHEALQLLWNRCPKVVSGGELVSKHEHVFVLAEGRRFTPTAISHEFQKTVRRAGVRHCTIHDMRRTFSTRAQLAGVNLDTVTELGGWSSSEVVKKHYTGDVREALKGAMDRIVAAG